LKTKNNFWKKKKEEPIPASNPQKEGGVSHREKDLTQKLLHKITENPHLKIKSFDSPSTLLTQQNHETAPKK